MLVKVAAILSSAIPTYTNYVGIHIHVEIMSYISNLVNMKNTAGKATTYQKS